MRCCGAEAAAVKHGYRQQCTLGFGGRVWRCLVSARWALCKQSKHAAFGLLWSGCISVACKLGLRRADATCWRLSLWVAGVRWRWDGVGLRKARYLCAAQLNWILYIIINSGFLVLGQGHRQFSM